MENPELCLESYALIYIVREMLHQVSKYIYMMYVPNSIIIYILIMLYNIKYVMHRSEIPIMFAITSQTMKFIIIYHLIQRNYLYMSD